MLLTAFEAVQSGLGNPIERHRFSDDPFERQVGRLAPLEDSALDGRRQERQLRPGADVGFGMPCCGGDLAEGIASAQISHPDMGLRQAAKQRTIWLWLTVADNDLSLDTPPAQFEGSFDGQNRLVNLIGLHSKCLGQCVRIQLQDNVALLDLPLVQDLLETTVRALGESTGEWLLWARCRRSHGCCEGPSCGQTRPFIQLAEGPKKLLRLDAKHRSSSG